MKVIDLNQKWPDDVEMQSPERCIIIKSWLPDKGGNWWDDFDKGTRDQVIDLSNHPVVYHHIALMADAHSGYGMPIGGVIACEDALIPNAVGVDGGCGMCSVRTNVEVGNMIGKGDLRRIREEIERLIPIGQGKAHLEIQDWSGFEDYRALNGDPDWLENELKWDWVRRSLGTLGGGNHFIELQAGVECQVDGTPTSKSDGSLWVTLHSGSRNLGHSVCSHHNKIALELNKKWHSDIPCKDLAFLPFLSPEGENYFGDMTFALAFAQENRSRMMQDVIGILSGFFKDLRILEEINIHHNYAALEEHFGRSVWVHRKGATLASKGTKGIIPGSMGTPTFIVEGLGNPESFNSCSHGAGRKMGRMDACRTLDEEACKNSMAGIEYAGFGKIKRKKQTVVDLGEAPDAYKDIHTVMAAQEDLVKPRVMLVPLAVVKG